MSIRRLNNLLTKLVGVSFCDRYPDNLLALHKLRSTDATVAVQLLREPDNPHDSNAIAVVCDSAGGFIGHVPAQACVQLAAQMDAGECWLGVVEGVSINPEHPDRPGVAIRCWPERRR